MADRSVVVKLVANVQDYRRGMQSAAGDTKALGSSTDKAGKDIKGLSASTAAAGGSMAKSLTAMKVGAAAAGLALVGMARDSLSAASALNEQVAATETIFGDASSAMLDFADNASSLGVAKTEALQAANAFGDLFTKIGFTTGAAQTFSEDLVRMSADFASFKDQDPSAVLDKLRSGLAGESEPLRSLGVFLTEAKVRAEGMALGLADASGELDEGGKVAARYSLIMKEMGQAQGDVERTADSYANTQRRAAAQTANLRAEIGQGLLPVMTDASFIAAELAGALRKLADGGDEGAESLSAFEDKFLDVDQAAQTSNNSFGLVADAIRFFKGETEDAGDSTDYLADSQQALADAQSRTAREVEATTKQIEEQVEALDALLQATIAQFSSELAFEQSVSDVADGLEKYNQALADNADGKADNDTSTREMADAQRGLKESLLQAADAAVKQAEDQAAAAGRTLTESQKYDVFKQSLLDLKAQFPQLGAEVDAYVERLGKAPATIRTEVQLLGLSRAATEIEVFRRQIANIPSFKSVTIQYNETTGITVRRPGGGRIVERSAAGGYISGPGTGTSDSIPALLSNGEYVIRASSVAKVGRGALDRINRYAAGGPVGFAAGGQVSATDARSLTTAVNGVPFGDVQEINRLIASWKAYNDELQQAARLRELLADEAQARADIAAAETVEESARAHEQLNAAMQATTDFQYAAARDAEAAAVQRTVDAIEREIEANRRANEQRREQQDNRYAVGDMTDAEYLDVIARRMADELKYSDEWTALWREREGILKQQADAEQDLTDAIRTELEQRRDAQQDTLGRLNSLLDAEAAIQARQVQAEAEYYTRRAALGRDFNAEQQRILTARRDSLANWARLDQVSSPMWGNTVEQLLDNAGDQLEQFREWMDRLADARGRGVSEDVISALGLDEGPQALGALRQFSTATQDEIGRLNAAVAARTALAGQQVAREQQNTYGALGRELVAAQQQFTAELAALEAEFLAGQREMAAELAAIGQDQGRSYSESLAAGIASGIPAIQAAAAAARAAMADLVAAQQPAPGMGSSPVSPGSPFKRIGGVRTATFDSGGYLQPGYTLAYNGTGQPERVLTAGQGGQQQVMVESHTYVMLDGQVLDHRVETKLGQLKGAAQAHGTRSR